MPAHYHQFPHHLLRQEWFIPWSELGVEGPPRAGQRFGLSGGYNDVDLLDDGAEHVASLRWREGCDPVDPSGAAVGHAWGDLEIGLGFVE